MHICGTVQEKFNCASRFFFGCFHESLDNFADFTKQQGTHASLSVATPVTELRFKVSLFCKVELYSCLCVNMVFVSLDTKKCTCTACFIWSKQKAPASF